jgi:hypothetical protein
MRTSARFSDRFFVGLKKPERLNFEPVAIVFNDTQELASRQSHCPIIVLGHGQLADTFKHMDGTSTNQNRTELGRPQYAHFPSSPKMSFAEEDALVNAALRLR